jgi:quinol-cytochrome oxidoreductase complex cytochrome b subunit
VSVPRRGLFADFAAHLFPRAVRQDDLRLSYTFCLGGLALTAFILSFVSGALLIFYYQPSPDGAYASILYVEGQVFGGRYVRSVHRLTSDAFLVLVFLHTLRVLLTGAFRRPRELNWVIGFVLLLLSVFEAYTGYLLPMDQLALWATQTGMELVGIVPLGDWARRLLLPDGPGQSLSLLRFYGLHVLVVPVTTVVLVALHFYRIRRDRGVLPYL